MQSLPRRLNFSQEEGSHLLELRLGEEPLLAGAVTAQLYFHFDNHVFVPVSPQSFVLVHYFEVQSQVISRCKGFMAV